MFLRLVAIRLLTCRRRMVVLGCTCLPGRVILMCCRIWVTLRCWLLRVVVAAAVRVLAVQVVAVVLVDYLQGLLRLQRSLIR
jgi:hypothetical protein